MAIVVVSRWKGNYTQALPIARQAAAILKRHGASSARIGPCHSGPAVTYPDWASYGRAQQQSQGADSEFQRVFAEFAKTVELQDRSVIVAEEL